MEHTRTTYSFLTTFDHPRADLGEKGYGQTNERNEKGTDELTDKQTDRQTDACRSLNENGCFNTDRMLDNELTEVIMRSLLRPERNLLVILTKL